MNIYTVFRTDDISYDQFDSFVCFAPDETTARSFNPDNYDGKSSVWNGSRWVDPTRPNDYDWKSWPDPATLQVELIGSGDSPSPLIILASFNAG